MKKKYRLYQIDSFTDKMFSGNPAGVVTNADGMSEAQMQNIARELKNSETAFIFCEKESREYDIYVRFFTPKKEVPICGHATIAAHYAYAMEKGLGSCRIIQKTGAGILPVDIEKNSDEYIIKMTQGKIEFGDIILGDTRKLILKSIGIKEENILSNAPIQIVSTGHSKVIIGIDSETILHELEPDFQKLIEISTSIKCNGYYVFTLNKDNKDEMVHGRMFAPAVGIDEDPATGNANGPLGAYLVMHKLVKAEDKLFKFTAIQGEKMNRIGHIKVIVDVEDSMPTKVCISGIATLVYAAEIHL